MRKREGRIRRLRLGDELPSSGDDPAPSHACPPVRPATYSPDITKTGDERDEYPSSVGRETRWLVETGATPAANGPGSLRTEQHDSGHGRRRSVGSGAERQRYRAAPIARDESATRTLR